MTAIKLADHERAECERGKHDMVQSARESKRVQKEAGAERVPVSYAFQPSQPFKAVWFFRVFVSVE